MTDKVQLDSTHTKPRSRTAGQPTERMRVQEAKLTAAWRPARSVAPAANKASPQHTTRPSVSTHREGASTLPERCGSGKRKVARTTDGRSAELTCCALVSAASCGRSKTSTRPGGTPILPSGVSQRPPTSTMLRSQHAHRGSEQPSQRQRAATPAGAEHTTESDTQRTQRGKERAQKCHGHRPQATHTRTGKQTSDNARWSKTQWKANASTQGERLTSSR